MPAMFLLVSVDHDIIGVVSAANIVDAIRG